MAVLNNERIILMEQNAGATKEQVNIPLPHSKRVLVTIAALMALFMYMFTVCAFAGAQPKIIAELGGMAYYTLLVTIFSLTSAITRPIAGKLGDLYGRKTIMNVALITFAVSALGCGMSTSVLVMLFFRALQGIGCGFIAVNVFALIGDIWEKKPRATVLGIQGTITSLAIVLGPILGGLLVDHLSWRYIFYVALPIALIPLVICNVVLPGTTHSGKNTKIDFLGALLLICSTGPLLLALTWGGGQYAWSSTTIIGLFVAFVVFGFLFVMQELKTPQPVVAIDLLRIPAYRMVCLVGMCTFIFGLALMAYFPLYIQTVKGMSATQSGLMMMPFNIVAMIVSTVVGVILAKSGKYIESMLVCAAFAAVCLFALSTFSLATSTAVIFVVLLACGIPNAMVNIVFYNAAQSTVPSNQLGAATGTLMFFCGLVISAGMSVLGAVINSIYNIDVVRKILSPELQSALGPKNVASMGTTKFLMGKNAEALKHTLPANLQDSFSQAIIVLRQTLSHGLSTVFILAGLLAVIACVLAIFAIQMKKSAEKESKAQLTPNSI
jgi:EmrB/QacA subfamily drug resistance transporter